MSRQQRRRQERDQRKRGDSESSPAFSRETQRPWYYRYGYHLGVWSGVILAAGWYAVFRDAVIALAIGIIVGQIAGLFLSRRGR